MRRSEEEGVRRLLRFGWRLLRSGQAHEAADVFGRVLLRRPEQTSARRGAERARQELAEQYRLNELSRSAPRRRPGTAATATPPHPSSTAPAARRQTAASDRGVSTATGLRRVSRRVVWTRRALLTSGVLVLCLALGIVAARWDALMADLSRPPTPSTAAGAPILAPPAGAGQRILLEAHRKIERGDPTAARELLQTIGPEDPAYPFAQRLQLELPGQGDQR